MHLKVSRNITFQHSLTRCTSTPSQQHTHIAFSQSKTAIKKCPQRKRRVGKVIANTVHFCFLFTTFVCTTPTITVKLKYTITLIFHSKIREFVEDEKIWSRPLFERLLSPSDIAQHYNSEADDDGSYVDKSEDDLIFEADTEVGSLSVLLRNQTSDISHLRDKDNGAVKTKKKKTTTTREKPAQPPATVRKFCLFLSFYFVLFLFLFANPIAIRVSILVFFQFQSHRIASRSSSTKTPCIFYPYP